MKVRDAHPEDVPHILNLERSCDSAAHWSEAEYTRVFSGDAITRTMLVADEGECAGFIVCRTAGPEWEIENVAVSPDRRGRGIGLQLVSAVLERARMAPVGEVHLEVRCSNRAARALYCRAGFTESGIRPRYYANPVEDAVLYRWQRLPAALEKVQ